MVRLLTLFLMLWGFHLNAEEIPDPRIWMEELPESIWMSSPGLLRNVTIVSMTNARKKTWKRVMRDFSSQGFLQYLDADIQDFAQKLNPGPDLDLQKDVLEILPAHLWLREEGSHMSVQVRSESGFKNLGSWGIARSDRRSSQAFLDWLILKLGYDGVVLDTRDELILVGLLKNTQEIGQGLLLKNSSHRSSLSTNKVQGQALLQILRIEGSLAVCEVLLTGTHRPSIARGSKILLGRERNLGPMMKMESQP
ncbi:MAG TPA: hypothetical protein VE954_11890 [Oligoflexus sp.]|uniref:hypothetical protein n=1 Tax=Oligoflexus sp. TaxID=1971216 RepID=UPI002D729290|nr:hypothetical protein [Oligoflexus sp.]HYX33806.1 hypothetical protein [Oligoflexus sp.]